jgi:hypothetical protein
MPEMSSGHVTGPGEDSEIMVDVDDLEILDFDQLARQLIKDAIGDVGELDADEDLPQMPLTICLPLQAIHSALQETPPA